MTQQHPARHLSRRMSRVTVTFFGRDICRDIRRESRPPDPTRPDPTPIRTGASKHASVQTHRGRARNDACQGVTS